MSQNIPNDEGSNMPIEDDELEDEFNDNVEEQPQQSESNKNNASSEIHNSLPTAGPTIPDLV